MSHRWILPALAGAALCVGPLAARQSAGNVCVIVLDDVGSGLIGSIDQHYLEIGRPSAVPALTPAIDTLLAQQGLTFTNAWSCPMCTPSRSAMLTGRMPSRTGLGTAIKAREDNVNPGLEPDVELLPQLLRQAPQPYISAAVGKWHLASQAQTQLYPLHPLGEPPGHWFDRFAGTLFNLDKPPGVSNFDSGYYVWEKRFATRIRAQINPCPSGEPPCDVGRDANVSIDEYPSVDTIDDAIALVRELPEPWFLYVSTHSMHEPLHEVPPGLPETYCANYLPPPAICDYPGLTSAATKSRCMLQAVDQQLGRLLCEINFNTSTVILVGDNGTAKRSIVPPYSQSRGKNSIYQGGLEVPLIVRSPLVDPLLRGTRTDALVATVDLFSTVLELTQAPAASFDLDSVSFVPCLTGQALSTRSTIYGETFNPNFTPQPLTGDLPEGYVCKRHDQALRDARYKLIRKWRRDHTTNAPVLTEELYDLLEGGDPDTSTNPPTPRPDWMELNDLLSALGGLSSEAELALEQLRAELDTRYPTVMH